MLAAERLRGHPDAREIGPGQGPTRAAARFALTSVTTEGVRPAPIPEGGTVLAGGFTVVARSLRRHKTEGRRCK